MKIVYFAHSLLSRGGDKMVLAHSGWLASHGHDVELCCNVVDTVFQIPDSVRITRPFFPGTFGTVLSAIFGRKDADVVFASIIPMACFLFPRSRGKVIYFAQDYDESYYCSPLKKRLIRFFYYVGLSLCRIPTIAVSYPLADLLKKRFRARVVVAENGVDINMFYPEPEPELITSKGERKAVLLLSRRDRRKGFDIARTVVGRLSETHSGIFEVWTVGEPATGFPPGIVHRDFGYVGEERLRRIMSSADVFLYPTRHEGFGLMPLEAFACWCPVVTTEAVTFASHLDNALVAPVGDIERITKFTLQILSGSAAIELLADRGLQTAEKMSLKIALAQFASILDRMVSGVKH
jgi:glycosyltransferase involved in cell wall biosynthesis